MQRNEYVLKNMFGSFFMATVMTALAAQLGNLTDSIVVSHLVSPDALSVFRIWMPIETLLVIAIGLMSAGAQFLSARAIGGQNYQKVNIVFNHHLYYVCFSALLLIALIWPFVGEVADLLTTNERLNPFLQPYIHAQLIYIFVGAMCSVPMSYIVSDGNPRVVTRCVAISQILNVMFDLLFCGVFDLGITGASYATTLSELLATLSLFPFIRKNSRIFCLLNPEKVCTFRMYSECFTIGIPVVLSALLTPVFFYILNTLIVNQLGADGMYVFTVYFQINSVCLLTLTGSDTAIRNIGGILIGEEDYDSLRLLMRRIFRLLTVVMLGVSLLMFIFPDMVARLFGATDSLIEQTRTPFRLVSLTFLPLALSRTFQSLYFVQGHQKLCRWIQIVTKVGEIGIIVLVALYSPELFWYILPFTSWLLLLMVVAMAYVVHHKNSLYSWPSLQSKVPSNPAVTFSVPYTAEGVEKFLAQVHRFIESCELPDGMTVDVALEELLYEIVETHTEQEHRKDEVFDVRIIDKEKVFMVVLKSKGPLRNPIYKYSNQEVLNLDESNMRRAILSRLCNNINYKYMNGINCIYLNYNRIKTPPKA